jgi:integrase
MASSKKAKLGTRGFSEEFVRDVAKPTKELGQVSYLQRLDRGVSLQLMVSYGGSKTWRAIVYRASKPIATKLGVWCPSQADHLTVFEAKKKAKAHFEQPDRIRQVKGVGTFGEVSAEWFAAQIKGKALREREVERCLDKYVNHQFYEVTKKNPNPTKTPRWRDLPFTSIERSTIIELLDIVERDHGAAMATAVLTTVKACINWKADRIKASVGYVRPGMTGLKRGSGKKRRALDTGAKSGNNEIKKIWDACDDPRVNASYGVMVKVALLTGQRLDRYLSMKWADITSTGVWCDKQGEREKNFAEMIPLPPLVRELIDALPRTGEYVFKARLDQVSGVTGWQFHSLRHSASTLMRNRELGIDNVVAEKVLGHRVGTAIEALYVHHDFTDDIGDALQKLADHIDRLVGLDTRKADVIPLKVAA